MQTAIWIIAALAVVALVVGVARAATRSRRTYVATAPATISVTEPVEDILESPRHAAEARAAETAPRGQRPRRASRRLTARSAAGYSTR
ncbi:hypothetical protein [Nocardioides sp. CER19]|uniref:hypothetical protein n=1 Tax=Nocardioides sp. CER19 TaxID=3038538 RepID=UPI00244BA729|nr:hypothetical protein [Nocardioides sp. CER19]MDH2413208.1 hypothetical protein [Nocardioides sp. CER19]